MPARLHIRLADVFAVTAVTASAVALVGAANVGGRETANRVKCASNLRQIGQAIQLYANENRGAYPRTTMKMDADPTWGTPYTADSAKPVKNADAFIDEKDAETDESKAQLAVKPAANDVTAALYLLLRTQDLTTAVFNCPSTKLKPFDFGGKKNSAIEWTNFPGKEGIAAHLSYSYQNPYPAKGAIERGFKLNNSLTAEFAVMADMNPGVEALLTAKADGAPEANAELTAEQKALNSLNHQSEGENVLYGDGHVEFVVSPFVGVKRDNIYVAADVNDDRKDAKPAFAVSPVDPNDSILLPTAEAVGQKVESGGGEIVPVADVAAAAKPLIGTYTTKMGNQNLTLVIDEKTLNITSGPMTLKYDYRVLGTRDKATVLELTAPQTPAKPMDLVLAGDTLSMDGEAALPPATWKRKAP